MATVLGTLGFVMGLVAIWLAAEALRRIDGKSGALTQSNLREFKAQATKINAMESRLIKLERRLRSIDEPDISNANSELPNPFGPYNRRPDIPFAPSNSYDA